MYARLPAAIMIAFAGFAWASTASASELAGGREEIPEAQALIDACWDISLEKRSKDNASAREGFLDTVLCLEEVILDQVEILFEDDVLTREQAKKELRILRFAAGGLYWKIYNENRGCFCGTMYYAHHLWENAQILESMIKEMIRQREKYGL